MYLEDKLNAVHENLEKVNSHLKSLQEIILEKYEWDRKYKRLTEEQVCNQLKVSKRTLQNYRDSGKLAFEQVGRKIFYLQSDIDEFLMKHRIKAKN